MDARRALRESNAEIRLEGEEWRSWEGSTSIKHPWSFFQNPVEGEGSVSLILYCLLSPFFTVAFKRFCKGKIRGESRNWQYLSSYLLSLWQQLRILCVAFWALPDEIYFLFSLQSFHFTVCPKWIVKNISFACNINHIRLLFIFLPRASYSGEEIGILVLSNTSYTPSDYTSVTCSSAIHLIVYFLLHAGQAPNKPYSV